MQFDNEIALLKSKFLWLKLILFTTITSLTLTLVLFFWQDEIPNSVIFLTIIGLALAILQTNISLVKQFDRQIELIANELLSEQLDVIVVDEFREKSPNKTNYSNKEYLRTRGQDEKGPSFKANVDELDSNKPRIDASKNTDYDKIESENTQAERLIRLADKNYSNEAEERWEESQSKDKDLIEAGVDNLGDLIKTDWFDKNKKDGAVKELYKNK